MLHEKTTRTRSRGPRLALAIAVAVPIAISSMSAAKAQGDSLPTVGIVLGGSEEVLGVRVQSFIEGMKRLGYYEGANVHYEQRYANGDPDLRSQYVNELVALDPAVILPGGIGRVRDIMALTSTIPIVATQASVSAVAAEIPDFNNPDRNFTAVTSESLTVPEPIKLALELVPTAQSVGVLCECTEDYRQDVLSAASELDVGVVFGEVPTPDDAVPAIQGLAAQNVPVMIVTGLAVLNTALPDVIDAAASNGIPAVYSNETAASLGGLISQSNGVLNRWFVASYSVHRVLSGDSVAEIPVMQIDASVLTINLSAAEAIGFTFPDTVLARATEVFE